MTAQPFTSATPALQAWLANHIGRGFSAQSLVQSMVESGYAAPFAERYVAEAFAAQRQHANPQSPAVIAPVVTEPVSAVALPVVDSDDEQANAIVVDGHRIQILMGLTRPHITLFENFLSAQECVALIALSKTRLERSPVVNPVTGDDLLDPVRTSMGAMFQVAEYPLLESIEARIAAVVGIPVEHGEGIQILNYKPGGEYRPHYDYFDASKAGEAKQTEVGGQRVATLVMYLNTVPAGGATAFPKIGLEVSPVQGHAVLFSYRLPDGSMDASSLHAGLPVTEGEKWIATKWLRERPYR